MCAFYTENKMLLKHFVSSPNHFQDKFCDFLVIKYIQCQTIHRLVPMNPYSKLFLVSVIPSGFQQA